MTNSSQEEKTAIVLDVLQELKIPAILNNGKNIRKLSYNMIKYF